MDEHSAYYEALGNDAPETDAEYWCPQCEARWRAVLLLITIFLVVSVGLFAGFVIPTIGNEGAEMIKKMPTFQQDFVTRLPAPLSDAANKLFEAADFSNPEPLLKRFIAWGTVAAQSLGEFLLVLVFAVYFVADGERVYR